MRSSIFINALLIIIVVFFPVSSGASDVQVVETGTLIKPWLIEDNSLPVISGVMAFKKAGYVYDAPDKSGLASIISYMLMEGAGDMDNRAFHAMLEERAIDIDISVDEDSLYVSLTTLSKNREEAFRLVGLILNAPKFSAESLGKVKTKYMADLRQMEEQPNFAAEKAFRKAFFGDHPYSWKNYPDQKTVSAITRNDLAYFMRTRIAKDNLVVSFAGDINSVELARLIKENFGALPEQSRGAGELPEIHYGAANEVKVERNIPQTIVMFGLPWIPRQDERYLASYLLNHIIGNGGFNSRLMKSMRERNGLTYGVSSNLDVHDGASYLIGGFATKNQDVGKAVALLKTELAKVAKDGVTEQELDEAKASVTGSFALNLDTNAKLAGFLNVMQKYNLGTDYLDKRNKLMNAVALNEVNSLANSLIASDKLVIGEAGHF